MNYSTSNHSCANCGGKFKVSTSKYVIRSRHSEKKNVEIENLSVLQCTICGNIEMTEASEFYIRIIREKIKNEMQQKVNPNLHVNDSLSTRPSDNVDMKLNVPTPDLSISNIKNIFKKILR